jgi:hypothetical protein
MHFCVVPPSVHELERLRVIAVTRPAPLQASACYLPAVRTVATTVGLLTLSNIFMTIAWYGHLKNLSTKPWYIAALVSWGVALLEYLIQVPANRIGYTALSLAQLKILQEVVTLCVFVPFAVFYMRQPLNLNFLWAGLCLVGAVFFMFR